ncbi:MAG TPA: long-chain fatty acid--CoA ligase [Thermoleophilaceae bacterium]|nr:long-chain fatty acid--CoA ligase [Thermoleophilaceae bacterium]
MQHDHPLTLRLILERMRRLYAGTEVVSVRGGERTRAGYAEVADRADRLCSALAALGVGPGDRVATFSWNTREHLEAYLAVPCMGAVLHTLNVRLFADQLEYVVGHAEDQVILVEDSLVPVLEELAPRFDTVRHYVVIGEGDTGSLPDSLRYEELLAAQEPGYDYPELDDRQAAGLCYTSGTTGNPKGVLYSHRSNVLHAMGQCMADSIGMRSDDRVMPVVPMFHANAWGIPYASVLTGAGLVMPGSDLSAPALAELIESEGVTVSAAVPTIWMDLLRHADEHSPDLSSVRLVICGGSAVPLSLMQQLEERHGVQILQAWGMTETSPLGSVARPPEGVDETEHWRFRSTQGRPASLVEARLVRDGGEEVPWDGKSTGELEVRGPWVARRYYGDDAGEEKFDDGWLRTGDIAAIDETGYIIISDRTKDVIKSGGEWISSVELENEIMAHPAVREAAVIARPDERWGERPLACVVPEEGETLTLEDLREHLAPRVAKWWLPDALEIVDEVPKTSVGKFDKKVLRARLAAAGQESAGARGA